VSTQHVEEVEIDAFGQELLPTGPKTIPQRFLAACFGDHSEAFKRYSATLEWRCVRLAC
jgi:hypothetical protein